MILNIIFGLFVLMFFRILFFHTEKPVRFKQIVRKDGRKMYRIDYLSRPKGGRLRW
jgi:hypothetical protein